MSWMSQSVELPYMVVIGFICIGIILFCICFCIDLRLNGDEYEDKTDEKNHKEKAKKAKKDKTADIEMDTYRFSSLPPYSPTGFSLETALSVEDDGSRKTPRVLRGSSAPHEGKGAGDQGRKSAKEKLTSGSRGGQSSWAYVNLALEKDADLILSPGTLKKRKEERTAEKERKRDETLRRKEDNVGEKWKEGGKEEETGGKTSDTGTRRKSESKETVGLKTFGNVRGNEDVKRQSDNATEISTSRIRKTWVSSKSWKTPGEGSIKEDTEEKTENEHETLVDVDEARGFRLKHLTKDWDTDVWKRGKKDARDRGESGGGGGSGGGESIHDEEHEGPPRGYDQDSKGEENHSSPRSSPVLLSRFSASTKLLLPEEEEEKEDEVVSGARTLDRGYTTTLTREQKGGWREGQISFFDKGKKRDFNYFSA